mmetsp:Transcript_22115/g.69189  ORF Transcript_22115/g.69189 Transcript_22115/m.69189 type:complete len:161 (-) Transcript_22115:507-989(-)
MRDADRHVSRSAFAYLFSEMVQYHTSRIRSAGELELKLHEVGQRVGAKTLELVTIREKLMKRESGVIEMLQFVSSTCWKSLFGKVADSLERSTDCGNEYMIHEFEPITNCFVSIPTDLGHLNCAAYIAGILAGMLDCAHFPAVVSAHAMPAPDSEPHCYA